MISCRNVTKRYGDFIANDNISFTVEPGSICALLGPNGAGKSTLLKILTGLLPATEGDVHIGGIDVRHDALGVKRIIGVLPENLALFDSLTLQEHLDLTAGIYGVAEPEASTRREQLLAAFDLSDLRHTFAGEGSHGMRKKTSLAMALLPNPKVLFLDEPFEGIDPVTAQAMQAMLRQAANHGMTILLSAHILSLVKNFADRIVVLRSGQVAWNSPSSELPASVEDLFFDLIPSAPVELPWLGR